MKRITSGSLSSSTRLSMSAAVKCRSTKRSVSRKTCIVAVSWTSRGVTGGARGALDREARVSGEGVVDHDVAPLARPLSQCGRGASALGVVPPQVQSAVHPGAFVVPARIRAGLAGTKDRPGRELCVVRLPALMPRLVNQGFGASRDVLGVEEAEIHLDQAAALRARDRRPVAAEAAKVVDVLADVPPAPVQDRRAVAVVQVVLG